MRNGSAVAFFLSVGSFPCWTGDQRASGKLGNEAQRREKLESEGEGGNEEGGGRKGRKGGEQTERERVKSLPIQRG